MTARRDFLLASALASLGAWSPWALAQNAPNLGTPTLPDPGFKRLRLAGGVEVISLNDGVTRRPLGQEFVRNAAIDDVRASLAAQGLPTEYLDVPYTAFLAIVGGKKVLMDTGFGDSGPGTTGRVRMHLQSVGIRQDDIDAVVITHFHGDHINGLRNRDGSFNYPKAKVYIPAPEFAFWMDDARMAAAPDAMKGAFQNVRRVFAQMPAGMLEQFVPGTEPVAGVRSIPAFGHTPGHTLFEVGQGNDTFTFLADTTNVPALFARNPDWAVMFDMDAEAARRTRREVFARLAERGTLVGGYHFPGAALARLKTQGSGFTLDLV